MVDGPNEIVHGLCAVAMKSQGASGWSLFKSLADLAGSELRT